MNILVFSYFYPPSSSVGAKRFAHLIENWLIVGHSVELVSAVTTEYSSLDETLQIPGKVHYARAFPLPKSIAYKGIARLLHTLWSKYFVFIDRHEGWIKNAVETGIGVVPYQEPDVIISTGPPFSSFIAAERVAAKFGIPLILDYRDPWSTLITSRFPPPMGSYPGRRMEQKLISKASGIITCTEHLRDQIVERFPEAAEYSHVITNGYSRIIAKQHKASDEFIILYAGSFYGSRRLSPLLKGLKKLIAVNPNLNLKIRVLSESVHDDDLDLFRKAGLENSIDVTGNVPYASALEEMAKADILYLPSGIDVKYALPYKLFDYLATGRPILAVCSHDSALAKFLTSNDCGYSCEIQNEDGIAELLTHIVAGKALNSTLDIDQYRWSKLAERYIEIISKAIRNV
ncbi:MAG: glycosyltransferase family 4 protein [Candidatus Aegiribacteria sp.]|nr:glycosyltransferase family 4 protein [Candidatus Aegiribacteria sp.]